MSEEIYGIEALRKLRERQAAAREEPRQISLLEQIPPDAPMADATITVWDGSAFVPLDARWLASRPVATEDNRQAAPQNPARSRRIVAEEIGQEELWGEESA